MVEGIICALESVTKIERIVVVVGGGRHADIIRDLDKHFKIGNRGSHRLAIMATQLNAYRLASKRPALFRLSSDLSSLPGSGIPIVLPLDILRTSRLPESWDVTSDSIAGYISHQLEARLLLVKEVDGVIVPYPGGVLVPSMTAEVLATLRSSPVDGFLPRYLLENDMEAWLINGLFPERVERLIKGDKTIHTYIHDAQGE